jgi:hypothetical protein
MKVTLYLSYFKVKNDRNIDLYGLLQKELMHK